MIGVGYVFMCLLKKIGLTEGIMPGSSSVPVINMLLPDPPCVIEIQSRKKTSCILKHCKSTQKSNINLARVRI